MGRAGHGLGQTSFGRTWSMPAMTGQAMGSQILDWAGNGLRRPWERTARGWGDHCLPRAWAVSDMGRAGRGLCLPWSGQDVC